MDVAANITINFFLFQNYKLMCKIETKTNIKMKV